MDEAEIGKGVADFLALVEARAADDAIGQPERDEALLELARLEARAHENGDLGQRHAAALQRLDLIADPARFLDPVAQRPHGDELAFRRFGPQRLAEAAFVLGDEARGGGEDVRRRAVVLLQPDDAGAGEILLEAQDVADLGAAPAIDRLIVVADAAEIAVTLRQQAQPQILRDVGVLVFVDQQIAKPVLVLRENLGPGQEDREVVQQ